MFWTKSDGLELIELTYAMVDEQDGYQDLFQQIQHLFGDSIVCLLKCRRLIAHGVACCALTN